MAMDFPDAPAINDIYSPAGGTTSYRWDGVSWEVVSSYNPPAGVGDVKSGFQVSDHTGWIKLDGRAVTTLTATQQTAAAQLGFTTNLPNGHLCSLRMDTAAAPGVVGGSADISLANLPVHNLSLTGVATNGWDPGPLAGGTTRFG